MNPSITHLQSYPFEKLQALLNGSNPQSLSPILWSIGEPKHDAPPFVKDIIYKEIGGLSKYPLSAGLPELREAIADWVTARFHLPKGSIKADANVLPVSGTREALFAFCHLMIKSSDDALVLMPNPFYQIYEGAALLSGAKPWYVNPTDDFLPGFDRVPESVWKRCQLVYICSPSNPTGAVMPMSEMQKLIKLADQFDFVIASDECYSEIYFDEANPPCGLLEAAAQIGRTDYSRCMVFHSLSKRSSLPGMRSGFVAGDARLIEKFKLYRTYHGCAMSLPYQMVSIHAWRDEEHVKQNRNLYRKKFDAVLKTIGDKMKVKQPAGSFYLWGQTPTADPEFARDLYQEKNLLVLPGSYLSREFEGINPGTNYVRMALVSQLDECIEGAERLRAFLS